MNTSDKGGTEFERREEKLMIAIRRQYSGYGYQEIVHAFELAVTGKLGVETYHKLDGPLLSRVMNAYNKQINRENLIRQYKSKIAEPMETEEQKQQKEYRASIIHFNDFIVPTYKDFNPMDFEPKYSIPEWRACDVLRNLDLLELSREVKDELWRQSKETAEEIEKAKAEEQRLSGDRYARFIPEKAETKRVRVYKTMCFYQQIEDWKMEDKELQKIEK